MCSHHFTTPLRICFVFNFSSFAWIWCGPFLAFSSNMIFHCATMYTAESLNRDCAHTKWQTFMITTTIDNPMCDGINSICTIRRVQFRYHIYRFGPFKCRQNASTYPTVHTIKCHIENAKLTHRKCTCTRTRAHTGITNMKTKWNEVE